MGFLFEVVAAFAAQGRAAKQARPRHVLLGPIPYHPVLAGVFLALALLFALAAGALAVFTVVLLTDDLMTYLGMILFPMAGMGVIAAIQFLLFSLDYSRRG